MFTPCFRLRLVLSVLEKYVIVLYNQDSERWFFVPLLWLCCICNSFKINWKGDRMRHSDSGTAHCLAEEPGKVR